KKKKPGSKPVNESTKKLLEKAENCFPPTAYVSMDLNNIRYGLESGGLLWYNKTDALYEVPKGSGINSMFAGGLWMGGKTPDNQLKLAAIKFRENGTDFWNGPLSIRGDANASNILCQKYDRHYRAKLVDVQLHNLWFERKEQVADGADESILSAPPFELGYSIPECFYEWPGNNFTPNYEFNLAPFEERIGTDGHNGIYDPDEGDYPGYDLSGTVDCRTRGPQDPIPLFGDETLWWVFNDNGGIHTESTDGESIGMKIKAQTFVYSTTNEINNMTFYNYVLINRGVQELHDTYFGQYADPDIGYSEDDYVGCDVQRGLGYAYNGDDFDESSGSVGYGANPPAIGIDFFEGPYMDPDGLNNMIDSTSSTWDGPDFNIPYPGIGLGFMNPNDDEPDMIIDNERFGMQKFVYYDRIRSAPQTDPGNAQQFYNYLSGNWQNGAPFTYGGTGIGGDVITNYEDNELDIYGDEMEALSFNDWFPYYQFSTKGSTTTLNDLTAASSALDMINVVPNPYYAFSFYETSRLDNRVKLINLPEECTIKIFNTAGTLVRTLGKDNSLTYLEWDLNNENNIQISGGAYIFHITAPGIGETTVKWFGVTRKLDLDNF
ncbi:MAG: hypothetical protein ACI8XB_001328, partial [Patiriisocius sp.]